VESVSAGEASGGRGPDEANAEGCEATFRTAVDPVSPPDRMATDKSFSEVLASPFAWIAGAAFTDEKAVEIALRELSLVC
jgi:hypothetical protein